MLIMATTFNVTWLLNAFLIRQAVEQIKKTLETLRKVCTFFAVSSKMNDADTVTLILSSDTNIKAGPQRILVYRNLLG